MHQHQQQVLNYMYINTAQKVVRLILELKCVIETGHFLHARYIYF